VALLASRIRFEEKAILTALQRHGVVVDPVDTRSLSVMTDRDWPGPWLALNREIGHFRALYAASSLESAGVTMVNSAAATGVCGDKWHTSAALAAHGLLTPRTALAMTAEGAMAALEEIGYPAVIKPLVGSWGRLVTRVRDAATAATVLEYVEALPSPQARIAYLQAEVSGAERDIRVLVVGGRSIGAIWRRGTQWRANVARGGATEVCRLTPDIARAADSAAAAVGAEIAGVDLIESSSGELYVIEVNDRVEFRGFQQAHGDRIDVAHRIASYVEHKLAESEVLDNASGDLSTKAAA
jgi:[lysine-biosynthesis-protein LysW]--L-2-aminoadipate ligase